MRCALTTIHKKTSADTDVVDITEEVGDAVHASQVIDGSCTIFIAGSTASITTIEFEPGAVSDLIQAIERLAPRGIPYAHDARWGDGNGYSHVRAALVGPSITVPVKDGDLVLGTWQQIVLVDFDNRPRTRTVHVQVIGRSNGR